MKKSLLAAIALTSFSAHVFAADVPSRRPVEAPVAPAQVPFDAFLSVGAGYSWATGKIDGESVNANGLSLESRASFFAPISGSIGFQADGLYERASNKIPTEGLFGIDSVNIVRNTGTLAGHIFTRNSSGLIGVFAQGSSTTDNVIGLTGQNRRYVFGVEGQYFLGNTTLYGQVGYQNMSIADVADVSANSNGFNLAGQVRHFVAPNFMVALKVDYEKLNGSDLFDQVNQSSWRVGIRPEYRLEASPLSVFADLSHRRSELSGANAPDYTETETRGMIGLKVNFGAKTLFERDRSGASLDPIKPHQMVAPLVAAFN